jgi:hypothetical protein
MHPSAVVDTSRKGGLSRSKAEVKGSFLKMCLGVPVKVRGIKEIQTLKNLHGDTCNIFYYKSPHGKDGKARLTIMCAWVAQCLFQGIFQALLVLNDFLANLVNITLNFWSNVCTIFVTNGCPNSAAPTFG